jgi:hypothetical protein
MENKPQGTPLPSDAELRDVCQTITGLPGPNDQLAKRLQFLVDLIADAKSLPCAPILLWREREPGLVHHELIGRELVIGRNPGESGLALTGDKLLSRRHFTIRAEGERFLLHDLQSHNGTAINSSDNRVQKEILHDGDLVLAGNHIFVFLNGTRPTEPDH